MMGNRRNKSDYKQSRRIYLFLLLSSVIFLIALFAFPGESSKEKSVTVRIRLTQVENPDVAKSLVVAAIKRELTANRLASTLESISKTTSVQSQVLGQADIEQVRNKLMSGALTVDATDPSGEDAEASESTALGFTIGLTGEGTVDEKLFVETLGNNIRASLEPNSLKERALAQLSKVQSEIRESNSLNEEGQKAIEASLDKFIAEQGRLFTTTKASNEPDRFQPSNWELKNLTQQRELVLKEYQANQKLEFRDKDAVQNSLIRRMEKLDQEIDRLRKKASGERMAGDDRGVKKASFIDSQSSVSNGALSSEVQNLKANLALAVNKIVLAQNNQKQTLRSALELSQMLQQNEMQVRVSSANLNYAQKPEASRIWVLLMASGILGAVAVMRVDSRAFATILQDEQSVESALQLPVIGQVNLPGSIDVADKKIRRMNQWVHRLIKFCELILLVAILTFLVVLWINSDFSVAWLNDPAQVLKNSFS